MAVLGVMRPEEIRRAVAVEDVDALTIVPGIGKRSAQKLVLELKPRLEMQEAGSVVGTSPGAQVRDALEGLGYAPAEVREVIAQLEPEAPVAEQLRQALRSLGNT